MSTDDQEKLTAAEVREAGLEDWRQLLGRLKARFHTRDFATGVALVDTVGAAATAVGSEPEITVTGADVVIAVQTPQVHGITARDLDLARRISAAAADLGVAADVTGLTQLELGLDTAAGDHLGPFYAALLGSQLQRGEPVDGTGQVPTVWWQEPGDVDGGPDLPAQTFEQRWHFDVWVPHDDAERRVQAVLAAGGLLVSDAAAPAYWVLEDADGNRSCICTPAGR